MDITWQEIGILVGGFLLALFVFGGFWFAHVAASNPEKWDITSGYSRAARSSGNKIVLGPNDLVSRSMHKSAWLVQDTDLYDASVLRKYDQVIYRDAFGNERKLK